MTAFRGVFSALACLLLVGCGPGGGMVDVSATSGAETGAAFNASARPNVLPPPAGSQGGVYRVSVGDIIEVNVFQLPDLRREAEVDGAGNVNLALIGATPAAGRTVRQLEEEIAGRYRARYLQNPQITVAVKDAVGQRITVDGAVKRPGVVMARGGMTLLRVLAEAQGFTETADQSNVVVMRNGPQGRTAARFDANAIRAGTMADPQIYGGDTVVVDDSTAKTAWKHFREALPVAGLFRVF
jgi:polysaccharide export outer membrane protein